MTTRRPQAEGLCHEKLPARKELRNELRRLSGDSASTGRRWYEVESVALVADCETKWPVVGDQPHHSIAKRSGEAG